MRVCSACRDSLFAFDHRIGGGFEFGLDLRQVVLQIDVGTQHETVIFEQGHAAAELVRELDRPLDGGLNRAQASGDRGLAPETGRQRAAPDWSGLMRRPTPPTASGNCWQWLGPTNAGTPGRFT